MGSVSMEWQGESDKGSQIQEMGAAGVVTGQGPGGQAHRGTGAMAATVG